jgi:predicted HTH domain antitoxin
MTTLTINMPDTAFSALRQDPRSFTQELRTAAAVRWFESGMISQAKGAEIAGLTRSAFIDALARFGVSPMQYTEEELEAEFADEG